MQTLGDENEELCTQRQTSPRKYKSTVGFDRRSQIGIEVVSGELVGSILKDRFYIARLLDQGSFGKVYKCIDIKNQERTLVIKVLKDIKIFRKEVRAMKAVSKVYSKVYDAKNPNTEQWSTPDIIH